MLENIKLALRIEGDLFDNELAGLISACKKDLEISGVVVDDSDPLIERAVVFYCKAYFGYAEKNYSDFVKS